MLYLVCEVCSNFGPVSKEAEKYLIGTSHVICWECRQKSTVPKELKNILRAERGMEPID
jgi:hypothetical protein